jgi:hypothetical protein
MGRWPDKQTKKYLVSETDGQVDENDRRLERLAGMQIWGYILVEYIIHANCKLIRQSEKESRQVCIEYVIAFYIHVFKSSTGCSVEPVIP